MGKRLILAVAGAGKTYTICHGIDPDKKNLILAFTHENIKNIRNGLADCFSGHIPENTSVMTFHSFLHRMLIRPYEMTIFRSFNTPWYRTHGVDVGGPPKSSKKTESGSYQKNPFYHKVDAIRHYLNSRGEYYCSLMSALLMRLKPKSKKKENPLQYILESACQFYDAIYVDEFQDFREKDYMLLMELADAAKDITLVGDYYQHSVSGRTNSGKPFSKEKGKWYPYPDFVTKMVENGFEVDTESLKISRRCSESVCAFVRKKLGVDIIGSDHLGRIVLLNPCNMSQSQIDDILQDDAIPKLIFSGANKYLGRYINWSYSKGDTFDDVCVILTEKTNSICDKDWSFTLTDVVRNKLYVALTRARHNVYLLSWEEFKRISRY